MPIKIKRKFEKEYGKEEGDRIFYAWENKHGMLGKRRVIRKITRKTRPFGLKI